MNMVGNSKTWLWAPVVVLEAFLFGAQLAGQTASPGVRVELDASGHMLRITLSSAVSVPVSTYRHKLPWGNRYSMLFAAVTADGKPLAQYYPVDDPLLDRVTLGPNSSLSGVVDLENVFKGFDNEVSKSVVNLFWAYKAPNGLGIPQWSGGWVLIPKQVIR